jgi:CubicO group peptidase (beta-lactamase class C family)
MRKWRQWSLAACLLGGLVFCAFSVPAAAQAASLTGADADAWLDGFMPFALARDDIAGAVVVIVKDGQVLTQRGFGFADVAKRTPVDPATTLFRAGSISKLFTWTAVMQLVEKGKLDLDADINRYLDFSIPPYQGQPITLRNLMTHTPGFEEVARGGIRFKSTVPTLGDALKQWTPRRVFAPGSTPAYSNYGAALAGYIVERVSGESFDAYIEQHIFQPLGMDHSSFRQPLPAALLPSMAQGYPVASGPPKPYELILVPPAGSLSMSGADAAKFMISHLNHAAGLLSADTADRMHDPSYESVAGTNRMALGFYEQRLNDRLVIAHGGDLNYFHSYLWLIPSENVGIFFSVNSQGQGSTFALRLSLFQQFGDRYFPAVKRALVELPTAKEHAKLLSGNYIESRGSFSNFLRVASLIGQTKIGLDSDGRPLVPDLFGGEPRQWIEVAPFQWQDAHGPERLAASFTNGRVQRWSIDSVSPFMVWIHPAWYLDAAWLLPAFIFGVVVVALVALSWPIGAISRRRYGVALNEAVVNVRLYRAVRLLCWWVLAVIVGWAVLFALLSSNAAADAITLLDWFIGLLQLLGVVGFCLLLAASLRSLWASRSMGKFKLLGNVVLAFSAVILLWVAIGFHLIDIGAHY